MAQTKTAKEPFVHVVRKDDTPTLKKWMIRFFAVLAALVVTGVLVFAFTGINPFKIYSSMITGSFGTPRRIRNTIKLMTPLLCLGIGLAPAFKMKFWNIGAQGQMLVGALAASFVALTFRNLPGGVLIPLMGLAGIAAGAVWGFIPAIFRAFWL